MNLWHFQCAVPGWVAFSVFIVTYLLLSSLVYKKESKAHRQHTFGKFEKFCVMAQIFYFPLCLLLNYFSAVCSRYFFYTCSDVRAAKALYSTYMLWCKSDFGAMLVTCKIFLIASFKHLGSIVHHQCQVICCKIKKIFFIIFLDK